MAKVREVHVSAIVDAVKKLCIGANLELEPDMLRAFDRALTTERSPAGRQVLQILKDNAQMAQTRRIPYCQDTGFVVCFVELGQDVHVTGGGLYDAINEGVRQGYREGYLRASEVSRDRVEDIRTRLKEGDPVNAMIINVDRKNRSINLSIKAKDNADESEAMQRMSAENAGTTTGTTNLGALLKAKLDNKTNG